MRRTLYALAALTIFTLASCTKNEDDPPIVPTTGSLRYVNTSADRYDIYLDDVKYGYLFGGDSSTYPNISQGAHRIKVIQSANIVGTPTLRQQIIDVVADSVTIYRFP
ncbi:MAG: hypothetical protein ABI378_15650 [Chitinophagaceae bacterium]